ncbi:uncharacterized protein LOC124457258 [Xenia sp. Carnegie-2017]|uniref:uncharacterized protein LOC124457258 n=1 Tax=Xenia sp. Carnegie-2017 TaxID=2897299 RepID=UPI001F03D926|nr:uncharacterized protein LOC124457258 [Xenia sp. Carnegie-2017]
MQGVGSVAFTLCKIKKDLFAFLEPKWEKRQTRHPTQHKSLNYRRTWNGENERVACFDGISIYKRDLNTLNDNSWVCDTIVDVLLRYYCKLAEKRNAKYFAFSNFFQQKLSIDGPPYVF